VLRACVSVLPEATQSRLHPRILFGSLVFVLICARVKHRIFGERDGALQRNCWKLVPASYRPGQSECFGSPFTLRHSFSAEKVRAANREVS